MADVDRRIRRGHARLNLSRAEEEKVSVVHSNQNTISGLKIKKILKSAFGDKR